MNSSISIRNAKFAKIGLQDMLDWIKSTCGKDFSEMEMVEIGCYVGDSTEIFAKNGFKKIHCIDPWKNGYDDKDAASFQHDMKIIENQFNRLVEKYLNIAKYKMKSDDALPLFKNKSLFLIYIDGLHTYDGVKNDMNKWIYKLQPNGFLCGHDYQGKFPGVIQAVNEQLGDPDMTFRDTSWTKQIKGDTDFFKII